MIYAVLLFSVLADPNITPAPSHKELFEAVVANREKIKSLHVRTSSRRISQKAQIDNALYLDVDANRWRIDTTGSTAIQESSDPEGEGAFRKKVSVHGGLVYRYYPSTPNAAATIHTLKDAAAQRFLGPFPDPRNAGIVPAFHGNTGTPFEIAGSGTPLHTFYVDCGRPGRVTVVPATWKGEPCWKVEWEGTNKANDKHVCRYSVVPQWGYSVVFLESNVYRNKATTPNYVFSVESEVALHKESQIWFPTRVHYKAIVDGKKINEEVTEIRVVSLNEPLPETVFTFKGMGVPAGHTVVDVMEPSTERKIWDGDRIVFVRGVSPIVDAEGGKGRLRWWWLGIAALCLGASIALWLRGLFHKRRAASP